MVKASFSDYKIKGNINIRIFGNLSYGQNSFFRQVVKIYMFSQITCIRVSISWFLEAFDTEDQFF